MELSGYVENTYRTPLILSYKAPCYYSSTAITESNREQISTFTSRQTQHLIDCTLLPKCMLKLLSPLLVFFHF